MYNRNLLIIGNIPLWPTKNLKKRRIWTTSLEKPVFNVSESRPISVLRYHWQTKQDLRYDMHYGLELGILLKSKMRRHFRTTNFDVATGDIWLCGMWEPHGCQITQVPCETVVLIIFPPILTKAQLDPKHNLRLLAPFEATPNIRPQLYWATEILPEGLSMALRFGVSTKNLLAPCDYQQVGVRPWAKPFLSATVARSFFIAPP